MSGVGGSGRRGELALLAVAVVAVSTSAPLVREAAAPALVVAAWRNLLAAAVLVPTVAVRRRDEVARATAGERRGTALAGVLLAAHFGTWIPSLELTTVASSVALVSTQPVWAALLARRRGQAVGRRTWLGIALALAGVLAVSGVDIALSGRALAGDALALAGGAFAAAYVSVGAGVRRTVSTTTYTAGCYAAAGIVLWVAAAGGGQGLSPAGGRAWICVLAITVGPQLLGHSVFNRLVRSMGPTVVSVAVLLEVVGAVVLARWWFGEVPPGGIYPAAVLLLAGVALVVTDGRSAPEAMPP